MKKNGKFIVLAVVMSLFALVGIVAQEADVAAIAAETPAVEGTEAVAQEAGAAEEQPASSSDAMKYIAAGLAVGLACIGGGLAVGPIGAAALGAISENEELSGKAMPFVGLAEGICLWGFLVALLVIFL